MKRSRIAMMLLAALSATTASASGRDIGNGGSVWSCRDTKTGPIRWIQLMDLFEASEEWKIPLLSNPALSFEGWLEGISARVRAADPEKSKVFEHYLESVKSARVLTGHVDLDLTNDVYYSAIPAEDTCPNGMIQREQVANFHDDGRLEIHTELWGLFTPMEKAALYVHEAVYAALRAEEGDTESRRARRITGLLFSKERASEGIELLPRFRLSQRISEGVYRLDHDPRCALELHRRPSPQDAFTMRWTDHPFSPSPCERSRRGKETTLVCDFASGACEGLFINSFTRTQIDREVIDKTLVERTSSISVDLQIRVTSSMRAQACQRDQGASTWKCDTPAALSPLGLSEVPVRTVIEASRAATGWSEVEFQCHINERCSVVKADARARAVYKASKAAHERCAKEDGIYTAVLVDDRIRCNGLLGGVCGGTLSVECIRAEFLAE